jgi:DNA-binding beta-propeller fold protein YncE
MGRILVKKNLLVSVALALLASLLLVGPAAGAGQSGEVVVANRASGTISVIDAASARLAGTYALPAGDNTPEPMYVTASTLGDRVFVGDRGNDRVVVFDSSDWSVVGAVPAGAGVFHMWNGPGDRQLWVNNDIDNTTTVIDPRRLEVIATVSTPTDLVDAGYKPHDVIVDPSGRFAYVTLVGGVYHDWVVQFSTRTFAEVNRAAVGLDPHVSVTRSSSALWVPAQNSNVVQLLDLRTLALLDEIPIPGAHGASMSPNGQVFYTTNLPGGGADGLWAIDTRAGAVLGAVDTAYAVPHNVVVTPARNVFVTHSGATSDKVTVYSVSKNHPVPVATGEVTVGLNPFGLAYVP